MGVVTGTCGPGFLRSPAWTALVSIFKLLFPFPAHAGLGVLENDPLFQKLKANLIGKCEVLCLLSGGTLLDTALHLGIGKFTALPGGPQHAEYVIEARQEL